MTMFPAYGFAVCGVVDDRLEVGSRFAGVPVVGRPKDLAGLVMELAVDRCILALPGARRERLIELMRQCEAQRIPYQLVPDLLDLLDTRARAESVDGVPLIGTRTLRMGSPAWALKRLIDVTVAWWGLVLLAPLLLLIAAVIRVTSPGAPALIRQERAGRFRRPFGAYAFRTSPPGPNLAAHAVGRLLRRTGLDALPQLLNVLQGDMSLVGPSPQPARLDERRGQELPRYPERGQVRPGLTGWAVANRVPGGARIEEQLAYDIYYIENWSLAMDLRIILLAALRLVGR
jgi:lipopolysaccharide/colanic/teichoic acid biosynthesis glycosyltransferase